MKINSIKRLLLGVLSSLLLAAGFVRAADTLDPVVKGAPVSASESLGFADDCTTDPTESSEF
jgi:hypothetical protein